MKRKMIFAKYILVVYMKTCHLAVPFLIFISFLLISDAVAYRPFESTDAAVVDECELEIELGLFTLSQDDDEEEIVCPNVVLNYGLLKDWEVVGECALQGS